MDNQTVIGIGCFAQPDKLSRLFKKLVQDYALGSVEGDQLIDQYIAPGCEGFDLLGALLA